MTSSKPIAAMILAASLILGCSEASTDPTAERPQLAVPDRPLANLVMDSDINPNDTWMTGTDIVVESTTVTSTTPFLDPVTQQNVTSLTFVSDPDTVTVTAGYGFDGQARITTGYTAPNELATSMVRQVGATTYDATQGQALTYGTFDVEPIATLGPLQDSQLDPTPPTDPNDPCADAIDVEACEEQQGNSTVSAPASRLAALDVAAGPRTERLRLDATHVRTIDDISASSSRSLASLDRSGRGGSGRSGKRTRDYEKHGRDWLLAEMTDEVTDAGPEGTVSRVLRHRFRNLTFSRNARLDSARTRRRKARHDAAPPSHLIQAPKRFAAVVETPVCNDETATLIVACDEPSSAPSGTSDPPAPNQSFVAAADLVLGANGGSTALALQHGFFSDARTWGRMQNWLHAEVQTGGIIARSTSWSQLYESQAGELSSNVQSAVGSTPTVFIGHSNGGMISRYLAQQQFGHGPASVAGVITIGTPHWGAPLANVASGLLRFLGVGGFASFLACNLNDHQAGCLNLQHALASGAANYYLQAASAIPVLNEMHWHSAYHSSFNAVPETFARYGIMSQLWTKWIFWRHYGDTFCYEDAACGGSKQVQKIDKIFHHDITCGIISGLFFHVGSAARCISDAVFLRAFDNIYQRYLKGPGEAFSVLGDGVVPLSSQTYPNVPSENLFLVQDGPSHVGETSDVRVKNFVSSILTDRLGLTRTQ